MEEYTNQIDTRFRVATLLITTVTDVRLPEVQRFPYKRVPAVLTPYIEKVIP